MSHCNVNYYTIITQNSCVYIKPSLNLYLTYLRGLEVAELKEEDMPMV